MMETNEKIYTVDTAAEVLQVTARYVRDKIAAGDLQAFRKGKRIYILHSDMINFVRSGTDASATKRKKKD